MLLNLQKKLFFLYLAFFALGQLPAQVFSLYLPDRIPSLHPTDIIIILIAALELAKIKLTREVTSSTNFKIVSFLFFSYILGLVNFGFSFYPLFYLLRLFSYIALGVFVYKNYSRKLSDKQKLIKAYVVIGLVISLFGWAQYLIFPDLRQLKILGWDDHYYRLVSTFFDPTFTGILLLLGAIVTLYKFIQKPSRYVSFALVLMISAMAFTYSRSTFLSAMVSMVVFYILNMRVISKKYAMYGLVLAAVGIALLPRSMGGSGVQLERVYSIVLKVDNSIQGIEIYKNYPLFGAGYNYICAAKATSSDIYYDSHSCHGLDNGLIYILATTGLVGMFIFLYFISDLVKSTARNFYGQIWIISLIAIFVHGMFTNTIFYPWVMGWMAILTGISRKSVNKS